MKPELNGLRIVYIGARIVGYHCLKALLEAGAHIAGVLYLDESKSGVTVAHCSFDDLIRDYRLNARPFTSLHDADILEWMRACRPDVGMVVGVSQLVGEALLATPQQGFIGMHPTLLPVGRGRAPIPWTLIKGLQQTGVSLFWCDPGADTGDILLQESLPVYYEDTAGVLGARTDDVAAQLLVKSLPLLASGHPPRIPQDDAKATVWPRRRPEDGTIDWSWSKRRIYDWVRALTRPYPGAFTYAGERKLFIWSCRESGDERKAAPGTVIAMLPHGMLVACGEGTVLLTDLQEETGAAFDAVAMGIVPGQVLGAMP